MDKGWKDTKKSQADDVWNDTADHSASICNICELICLSPLGIPRRPNPCPCTTQARITLWLEMAYLMDAGAGYTGTLIIRHVCKNSYAGIAREGAVEGDDNPLISRCTRPKLHPSHAGLSRWLVGISVPSAIPEKHKRQAA